MFLFLMRRPPPRSTRTYTRFPYTTLVRSQRFTDLAPVRLTCNLSEDVPDRPPDIHFGTGGVELTRGRLRDSLRLITTDPEEDRASRHLHQRLSRSEERRVGKECVSTCSSRWSPYH